MLNRYKYIWWEDTETSPAYSEPSYTVFTLKGCDKELILVIESSQSGMSQALYEEDGITPIIENSKGGNLLMQVPFQEFLRQSNG